MENIAETTTLKNAGAPPADMAPLMRRVREFLDRKNSITRVMESPISYEILTNKFGFAQKGRGATEIILSENTAVELGRPETASLSAVLLTFGGGMVRPGNISIVGPDIGEITSGAPQPFAQIVMLRADAAAPPDPFALDNTQYLTHRLPGCMARSVPGRLWLRISRQGLGAGLNLGVIGSTLIHAYTSDFENVRAAEVVFVTSSREDVEMLEPVKIEAGILAGRHRKLALGMDGDIECRDLNCDACEEKPVCDNLRDVIIKRRVTFQRSEEFPGDTIRN